MSDRPREGAAVALRAESEVTGRVRAWIVMLTAVGAFVVAVLASPPSTRVMVEAVGLPLATATASIGALFASRRCRGKRYRLWQLVAVAMAAFFIGFAYRAYSIAVYDAFPAFGSLEDVAFVFGFLTLVPVVLLMTDSFEVVGIRKVRSVLDLASIFVFVLGVATFLVFGPYDFVAPGSPILHRIAYVAYAAFSTTFVLYLLVFKRSRWRSADVILLLAFLVASLGVLSAVTGIDNGYAPGTTRAAVADSLLFASFALFALASHHAGTQREHVSLNPTPEIDLPYWPGVVAIVVGLVGIPLLIVAAQRSEDSGTALILSASAALLALLSVVRSAVVTVENRRLAEESTADPLTGVFNHRYFRIRTAEEVAEALANQTDVTVCVFDIDHFDEYNSELGYRAGDQRLQSMARLIDMTVRDGLTFRIGGDDFAILLAGANAVRAQEECRRISQAARTFTDATGQPVTMSIGIASCPLHASNADDLIRYAIGAAYWGTVAGGDRCILFDPGVVDVLDSHQHLNKLQRQSGRQLIEALAAAVDARDPYTRYHSANVSRLTHRLAVFAGLDSERARLLGDAALMHDVGKIGIPDAVLLKEGTLEAAEYEQIKEHPALGAHILGSIAQSEMLEWIVHHHEWWDGSGYPHGISGGDIPYESRLLSICDAYDAMTSERPYREGRTLTDAVGELQRHAGTQFDPDVVALFVDMLAGSWPPVGDDESARSSRSVPLRSTAPDS